MKLIVFTTDTPHHLYFVKKLSENYRISNIIVEKQSLSPPFDVHHPFEDQRDQYEKKVLLDGLNDRFDDFSKTIEFENINDEKCVKFISDKSPDVILTFGTGIIKKNIIDKCPDGIINLHGGDPQYYRGLDSHLWAIYHKDFTQLKVSLHRLNTILDDGEIIEQKSIKITKGLKLYMLRAENTKLCIELTCDALRKFSRDGIFRSIPQRKIGRYYSFMPSVLKEIAFLNFNNFVKGL